MRSRSRDNARAGVAVFGARAALQDSVLTCNAFDLDVEQRHVEGAPAGRDYHLEDRGGNECGCESSDACKAVSSGLEPALPPG